MKKSKLKIDKFQISKLNLLSNIVGGVKEDGTGTKDKQGIEEPNLKNTFSVLCVNRG
ncbi:hypothetical protein [uncultured Nonlabens sp.]|uniref:hypothetical protein n=1 Tax=uncultured Nonlabens sp. TaxID=859306 RepID=UPI00260BE7A7|nr:hypothetical protein [uncultured Nonlabens sp.]